MVVGLELRWFFPFMQIWDKSSFELDKIVNDIVLNAFIISPLQTKLKSAVQLQDLLDATRMLVPRARYFKFSAHPML